MIQDNYQSERLDDTPVFSSNVMRLTMGQWFIVIVTIGLLLGLTSSVWKYIEKWDHPVDYRIPYALSRDYWLYQRHLEQSVAEISQPVFVVGDSVVWGEFVDRESTLSHALTEQINDDTRFVNAGVNGLFPLALEGLVREYGEALYNQRVILHCNLLWMSSAEADLSSTKEQTFNHAQLVPQFSPWIPCYKEVLEKRLSTVLTRHSSFLSWNAHLQICYYDSKTIPEWTLTQEGRTISGETNARGLPWTPVTFCVPAEPTMESDRGPQSPRHQPWFDRGLKSQSFDWVATEESLQWSAYRRLVKLLRERENKLYVVLGPFNEHLVLPANRVGIQRWKEKVVTWLRESQVPVIVADTLATQVYADASHPLTLGYQHLAAQVAKDSKFITWLSHED